MKSSFKSTLNDPLIKDLIKFAAIVVASIVAFIGIKTIKNYFKK